MEGLELTFNNLFTEDNGLKQVMIVGKEEVMGPRIVPGVAATSSKEDPRREKAEKTSASGRRITRSQSSITQPSSALIDMEVPRKHEVDEFNLTDLEWTDKIPDCPVYCPTKKEFADPLIYLQKIAPEASKYGICKIISPLKASIPAADVLMKEKQGLHFHTYVQPLRLAKWDMNDQATFYKGERKYTYNTFKRMADEVFVHRFPHSQSPSPEYLENEFWHEMSHGKEGTVEYAVNVEGSAFSCDPNDQLGRSKWNLKTLPKLSKSTLRLLEYPIPGITDPMLYIGMLFSMFAWHVEDHYLYSMNYHHAGAPKTWYGVPGHAALWFEKVTLDHVYCRDILSTYGEDGASKVLAQKTTMFPPNILLQNNVPVYKAVQNPGEFVVTFPRAYHAGFNNGFSCGEAVNFAIGDWFPFGAAACQRYAILRQMPILPYEQLLCKEVLHSKSKKSGELASRCPIMISFLRHIRPINNALWHLNNLRALFTYSPKSQGTILCDLCKRDCYLAFIECSSCYKHTCLFHEVESLECCSCLSELIVFLRVEIRKVEDKALQLEAKGILPEEVQHEANMRPEPNVISSIQKGLQRHWKKYRFSEERAARETTKSSEEAATIEVTEKDDNVEFDVRETYNKRCNEMRELSYSRGTKKTRMSCRTQMTETEFNRAASSVF